VNEELTQRVERIREVLAARDDAILLGKFPPGRPAADADLPPGVADVLAVTDGPRAGLVKLASLADITDQFLPLERAAAIEDPEAWVSIGARNYEPLLAHRKTGEVWWFPDTGVVWQDSTVFEKLADDATELVLHYLLGDGYLEIIPDYDDWAELLIELGWADDTDTDTGAEG
jgi:hypothetical protein